MTTTREERRRNRVGQALRTIRQRRGITQDDAADRLGISQAALSHYERGLREQPYFVILGAVRIYDVPISEFVP